MKKVLYFLICLFAFSSSVMAVSLPKKTDHEKVSIYIFRGNGCSHCHEALEYFNENIDNYSDYIEVKTYEVWYNKENSKLADAVAKSLGETVDGVPYIVVGSKSYSGFSEEYGKEIIKTALKEYENKKYSDIVKKVAKSYPDAEMTSLIAACKQEGIIDGKVTIYVFRNAGAEDSNNILKYLYDNLEEISEYANIKTYEVSKNNSNNTLLKEVVETAKVDYASGPMVIVGDKTINASDNQSLEKLLEYAKDEYTNDSYTDVVSSVAKDVDGENYVSLEEACEEENIIKSDDSVVIISIFAIIAILVGSLVFFGKKRK